MVKDGYPPNDTSTYNYKTISFKVYCAELVPTEPVPAVYTIGV